ncbi:subtilisin-like protein [Mycena vitilis]|nr:subtilisin-like protein [Mycena vitilis]
MPLKKLLVAICLTTAASASTPVVLHERRNAVPSGFLRQGAAPATDMLTLRVGLSSNNVTGLQEKLGSIATPGSPDFRQWLSKDEVKAYTQPSEESLSAFHNFASSNGLTPTAISSNGDWHSITLPVSQANALFAADYELFTHPSLNAPITRTLSVSLPSELVGHVDVLHPSTAFVVSPKRLVSATSSVGPQDVSASCNSSDPAGIITPTCLQELYGIPTTPATETSNTLLVTGYVDQWAQRADLAQFLKLVRPDLPPNTTFTVLTRHNATNPQGQNFSGIGEANMDVQYTTGIATGVPIEFLSVGNTLGLVEIPQDFLDTTTFLDGVESPPSVMTTSYGFSESFFGPSVATRICNGYMALGARGISVIFASGDGGVRGQHDDLTLCANNTFDPVFPATCPFVTAVGSTQGFAPEKALNLTGGGFSNVFAAPSFQSGAVSGFLKTVPDDFPGIFNKTGRGYPDVSTQGWNFQMVNASKVVITGGASASAPVFASVIALINDRLIAANRAPLGYLNPFLYSKASSAFTDITAGHNSGVLCPASSVAFDAVVAGHGTPVFADLLEAAFAYS